MGIPQNIRYEVRREHGRWAFPTRAARAEAIKEWSKRGVVCNEVGWSGVTWTQYVAYPIDDIPFAEYRDDWS